MPTAGSNFSRYKIPDEINPPGVCCICVPVPDSREYRAQFHGAIWRMGIQSHYERDTAHSAKLVAAVWRKIWEDLQVSDCGCSPLAGSQDLTLINIQNQTLIQAWFEIWVEADLDITAVFPATPDLFDSDPGDAGDEVAQRTRALCLAVNSWVDELMNRGLSYAREAGVAIGSAVSTGFALPSVPTWLVVGSLVTSSFALSELAGELQDTPYRRYLICGMLEALTGTTTGTPTSFAASWDNLPARPPPPESVFEDVARDAIEAWGRSQLNNADNYLAFVKTLNIAMGVASSISDAECVCTSDWEHTFDFTIDEQGWTAFVTGAFTQAAYHPGIGWKNGAPGTHSPGLIQLNAPAFAQRLITFVEFTLDSPLIDPGSVVQVRMPNVGGAEFADDPDAMGDTVIEVRVNANGTGMWVSTDNFNFNTYTGTIIKLVVSGEGTDPF